MEIGILRNWPVVLIVTVLGLSLYAMSLVFRSPAISSAPENLSYEMIRPEASDVEYDLSARVINRNIRSFGNKGADSKAPAKTDAKADPKKAKNDPKKKDADKKKAQNQKKKPEMIVQIQENQDQKMFP